MTKTRRVIDVSDLPLSAMDHRSPIWIGNALLLAIETTMFAILVATYFYLRANFQNWPPPQINYLPPNFHPAPDLLWGTLNLLVGVIEDTLMFVYISKFGLDDKHARDVRVTAVYWYWIAGIWVPLYVIVYFGPYWLGL